MKTSIVLILVVALLALTGCVTTHVEMPNGFKFSRTSLLNKANIGSVKIDPKGAAEMTGYANDTTEIAVAVTEAAVRGATQAAKLP